MFAACTDAATAHGVLYEDIELSVHAGDATEREICVGEGHQQ